MYGVAHHTLSSGASAFLVANERIGPDVCVSCSPVKRCLANATSPSIPAEHVPVVGVLFRCASELAFNMEASRDEMQNMVDRVAKSGQEHPRMCKAWHFLWQQQHLFSPSRAWLGDATAQPGAAPWPTARIQELVTQARGYKLRMPTAVVDLNDTSTHEDRYDSVCALPLAFVLRAHSRGVGCTL